MVKKELDTSNQDTLKCFKSYSTKPILCHCLTFSKSSSLYKSMFVLKHFNYLYQSKYDCWCVFKSNIQI